MNIETIIPDSHEHWLQLRAPDVTSTESAALFDLSPYITRLQLYHAKRSGEPIEIPENERMRWGKRLETAIALGISEDLGIQVSPMRQYMRRPDARMGASFDFRVDGVTPACWDPAILEFAGEYGAGRGRGPGVFEIKNVDYLVYRDLWTETEAPEHIEIQVQHQMHVCGLQWAVIGVLVAGHTPRYLVREYDPAIGAGLEQAVRGLWSLIEAGTPPEAIWPADAAFVAQLHRHAEPDTVYDGRADEAFGALVRQYYAAQQAESAAKKEKDIAKARLFAHVGARERALDPQFNVWLGVIGPAEVPAHTRSGYRGIRVTPKKGAAL